MEWLDKLLKLSYFSKPRRQCQNNPPNPTSPHQHPFEQNTLEQQELEKHELNIQNALNVDNNFYLYFLKIK